jgi:sorting nexin-1/2
VFANTPTPPYPGVHLLCLCFLFFLAAAFPCSTQFHRTHRLTSPGVSPPSLFPWQKTDPVAETTASASAADAGPNPPTPPPPPYESVVLDDPRSIEIAHSEISHSGKAVKTQTQKPKKPVTTTTRTGSDNDDDDKAEVEVASAVKIGEGMSAYAAYPVRFVTDSTDAPATYAQRRFSDFTKLRRGLQKSHPGCVVHPLPEKIVTTSPFSPEFLTQRRRGLGLFLSEIAAHPVLAKSEHLSAFLTPDEIFGDGSAGVVSTANGWAVSNTSVDTVDSASPSSAPGTPSMKPFQKSPSQQKLTDEAWYHRGAAGTALSAVDGWFKQVATATESFVHGATPDTVLMEEDQTYLEASEYLLMLEDRLRRAARASDEVVSCVNAGGLIIGNFGDNCVLLGDVEERGAKTLLGQTAGGLGQAFRQVGAAAISTRAAHEQKAEQLANEFRAPIRDALELVRPDGAFPNPGTPCFISQLVTVCPYIAIHKD